MRRGWAIALCLLLLAGQAQAEGAPAPAEAFARILRLEDARSLGDGELERLLRHPSPEVRSRAALALGRIGEKRATPALLAALAEARGVRLRLITVFALGEMEDAAAVPALLGVLDGKAEAVAVRARAAEALGKIASLPPNAESLGKETLERINRALIALLPAPAAAPTPAARLLGGLTITALLRLQSPLAVEPLAGQLTSRDAALRASAANVFARLGQRLSPGLPALLPLVTDSNVDVRANAARALGQSRQAGAFEPLVRLLDDPSDRVQVSAVRGLATLADRRAIAPLRAFGEKLFDGPGAPRLNLLLEVAPALAGFKEAESAPFFHRLRALKGPGAYPEVETALLGLGETEFWKGVDLARPTAGLVTALGELGTERARAALQALAARAEQGELDARSLDALLTALGRAKLACPPALARRLLDAKSPGLRASAARILIETNEENFAALARAYAQSGGGTMVAARISLLGAFARYKTPAAEQRLRAALDDPDLRVRRRAVTLLREAGVAGLELPEGPITTHYGPADYARVRRLETRRVTAAMRTTRGTILLEFFPREAPMTVDNFLELARRGYFENSPFHRIVPNFVAQGGGDPRDEGGPGHQIRCEINLHFYERGTMGMALAGKDTGTSQFFFCHAPQPHLDGGYTVFGRVLSGMEIVDRLTREDRILRIDVR